ncbi:NADH-quinone oxidoreductase subunit NuoE [Desulfofundulus sp. TPOSR]|uniref:NADH-quinone oxidoreductase subunit NuoE n=1 Tax=Desulfofundulus sp. TPOSR TaxID=2714340 RepID=UPI00140D9AF8|nr:NADH-quinone oxidoreductase subunit NuoE [Desulfofundulus sp. TPOSR]NHM28657.1 NADH-quinone oxidoreductase subunit NuoE [Desulfofundulus sp. TPOSR]
MHLTEEEKRVALEQTGNILENYSRERGNLIPILQQVQEKLGYVPLVAMEEVARHLGIPAVDVYSVATFYNQFRLIPPGKHQIKVCMGTACHMKGGNIILDCWKRRLGIDVNQVTPDREFSLERVACVGCCTMAPVTVIDEEVHGRVTPTRVDGLLFSFGVKIPKGQQKEGEAVEQL